MQAKINHNLKSVPDLMHGTDIIELLEALNDTLTFLCRHKETNLASVLVQYFHKTKRLEKKVRLHTH